jgi:5-bromo-4-chloroindolyl phosphate hydrolysis protein
MNKKLFSSIPFIQILFFIIMSTRCFATITVKTATAQQIKNKKTGDKKTLAEMHELIGKVLDKQGTLKLGLNV